MPQIERSPPSRDARHGRWAQGRERQLLVLRRRASAHEREKRLLRPQARLQTAPGPFLEVLHWYLLYRPVSDAHWPLLRSWVLGRRLVERRRHRLDERPLGLRRPRDRLVRHSYQE